MDEVLNKLLDEGKISKSAYLNLIGEKTDSALLFDSNLKISVLISTYKRPAYLIRILESIRMQGYKNSEIVIVDDASGDDTGEIVKQYKAENSELEIIYSVNEKNLGVNESKKRAYQKATGDIIIFADDDDYYIEPEYFCMLSRLYEKHPDCTMTIAATIRHIEREGKDEFLELNTPEVLSTREYLNGFMGRYEKPGSMFTMSLRKKELERIHYEELLCFNDTSLYLYGLLGNGNVYTINQAVGVYFFHTGNMTGNTSPGYIVANLESKEDIYQKALAAGLLDDPKEWHYRSVSITAGHHLVGSRSREDIIVWKWMKEHLDRADYYRFAARMVKSKVRRHLVFTGREKK